MAWTINRSSEGGFELMVASKTNMEKAHYRTIDFEVIEDQVEPNIDILRI